jgi:hypothetical protein
MQPYTARAVDSEAGNVGRQIQNRERLATGFKGWNIQPATIKKVLDLLGEQFVRVGSTRTSSVHLSEHCGRSLSLPVPYCSTHVARIASALRAVYRAH